MTRKKVIRVKNKFIHACQTCKGIFEIYSLKPYFFDCFLKTLSSYLRVLVRIFSEQSFQIVSTISGWTDGKI